MTHGELSVEQRRALRYVNRAASEGEVARERLVQAITNARGFGISLQRIADEAGISREKARVLAGEATYQKERE